MGFIDRITGRFRRGEVSGHGYPEEQPPGAGGGEQADETPQREAAKAGRRFPEEATDTGDGKATGNPRSAG